MVHHNASIGSSPADAASGISWPEFPAADRSRLGGADQALPRRSLPCRGLAEGHGYDRRNARGAALENRGPRSAAFSPRAHHRVRHSQCRCIQLHRGVRRGGHWPFAAGGCLVCVSAAFGVFNNLNILLAIAIPAGGAQVPINLYFITAELVFISSAAGRSLGLDGLLKSAFPRSPLF